MRGVVHLLVPVLLVAAVPAAAQEHIAVGETVEGELADGDRRAPGGEWYDAWTFDAEEGRAYVVTMWSDDFDAYLRAGPAADGAGCDPCERDDDGAGGTDAQVELVARGSGTWLIQATSYEEGESGRYRLMVRQIQDWSADTLAGLPAGEAEPVVTDTSTITRAGPALEPGFTATGVLEPGDLRSEAAFFDVWLYTGRAGEIVSIDLRSDEFDTVLRIGRWVDGRWTELASDDDGGGGTDSHLTFTLPADTRYEVHAAAYDEGEEGAYSIVLEADPDLVAPGPDAPMPPPEELPWIVPGATRDGVLGRGSRVDEEGAPFDAWTYFGGEGETVTLQLASDEVDGVLRVGIREDGVFRELGRGAADGGTRAEVTLTLPAQGLYEVQAGASGPGASGAYTLYSITDLHDDITARLPAGTLIPGQTVRGRLEEGDAVEEGDVLVDEWTLSAPGEVTIDLRSEDFDPVLRVLARGGDGEWRRIALDDDGGTGTDSRLTFTAPDSGGIRVLVTTHRAGDGGDYLLSVRY